MNLELQTALQTMNLDIPSDPQQRLLDYLIMLEKWNKSFNLTAIRDPQLMLPGHILDSLSLLPYLKDVKTVLDVGTGAGLPGIPLAIARPDIQFTLVDSQQKKINFVQHVVTSLQLTNVVALQQRIEMLQPAAAVDMVVSRAFASLNDFVNLIANLCNSNTRIIAMKGRKAQAQDEQQHLPQNFIVTRIDEVAVPGLNAERCLVVLKKQGD